MVDGFASLDKPSKSKLAKPWTALNAALNRCNAGTGLHIKLTCGGIKASRVILDSHRGGVHRGAPAVTLDSCAIAALIAGFDRFFVPI